MADGAMADGESHSDAVWATQVVQDSKQTDGTNTEDEDDCTCPTGEVPSLQELEEVLHSAPRSCRHGDEVWPNLFLGDMCATHPAFRFKYMRIIVRF